MSDFISEVLRQLKQANSFKVCNVHCHTVFMEVIHEFFISFRRCSAHGYFRKVPCLDPWEDCQALQRRCAILVQLSVWFYIFIFFFISLVHPRRMSYPLPFFYPKKKNKGSFICIVQFSIF